MKVNTLFLFILLLIIGCANSTQKKTQKDRPPNFVIIVADDAGYSDVGFFGGEIQTPNIDFLAENGVVFPNFYNFSRCSPTRASLMTGLYPQKVGVGELCGKNRESKLPGYLGYLDFKYPTIAEVLQQAGYHNIICGKWHLGNPTENKKTPLGRGFDDFFGLNAGESTHFTTCETSKPKYYLQDKIYEDCDESFYSSNKFTDFAIQFLEKNNKEKPFLLYLPYTAPHNPIEAPQEVIEKYRKIYTKNPKSRKLAKSRVNKLSKNIEANFEDYTFTLRDKKQKESYQENQEKAVEDLATRAAMLDIMDQEIGRIIAYLENEKLDNTIILYFSDNGGSLKYFDRSLLNAPYKGRKTTLDEGGTKTPFIAYGKNLPSGEINNSLISVMDIFPTVLSMIGLEFEGHQDIDDKYKGIDISEAINTNKNVNREYFFWDLYEQQAVIKNDRWKWINTKHGRSLLFDLKNDPLESIDIRSKHKEITKKMKQEHFKFRKNNNVVPYPKKKPKRNK